MDATLAVVLPAGRETERPISIGRLRGKTGRDYMHSFISQQHFLKRQCILNMHILVKLESSNFNF